MNTDKLYAEQLANEYAPKNTSRVVALRKLDAKAKLPATAFTYAFGITSALIFGTGLCLAMGQIGSGTTGSFVLGILMGVVGMAVNFLYVAFRIAAGIRYASVWFLTMAVYYLVLGCLRVYLDDGPWAAIKAQETGRFAVLSPFFAEVSPVICDPERPGGRCALGLHALLCRVHPAI